MIKIDNQLIFSKSYKDAESAYQKFYKADKNLEISRLELEKARNHASVGDFITFPYQFITYQARNEVSDKAKADYSSAVSSANDQQKKYHEALLPVIFQKLKSIDKETISDMSHVLQKIIVLDECQAEQIGN